VVEPHSYAFGAGREWLHAAGPEIGGARPTEREISVAPDAARSDFHSDACNARGLDRREPATPPGQSRGRVRAQMRQGTRIARIALILCTGGATVLGCGGSGDDPEAVVHDFLTAVADGNGDKACDQLTGSARRELLAATGKESCDAAAQRVSNGLSDDEKDKLKHADLSATLPEDQKAKEKGASPGELQELRSHKLGENEAIVHVKGGDDVPLEKVDGDYKITSFSG
jgi:hypothetical protein